MATISAYCVRCRAQRDMDSPVQFETKRGLPALKGTCQVCKAGMVKLVAKPQPQQGGA